MNISNSVELEWQKTISCLSDRNGSLKEFEYFLNLAKEYISLDNSIKSEPRIIILSHYFPEEIIRAMGVDFYYVFGGSYESSLFKNVNLPIDASDTIKSIMGILKSDTLNLRKDDVLLVPLCTDSMIKLSGLINDRVTVIGYEVPPDKKDVFEAKRFVYEIVRVTQELKKHFKKKLSLKQLKKQCEISKKVFETFNRFEKLWREKDTGLTLSAFLFITNSYYMCKNKVEWVSHLESLILELEEKSNLSLKNLPEIMLIGSPIYAPNYKVLFTIEEMQLKIRTVIQPNVEHIKMAKGIDIKSVSIKYLAEKYFENDITPVFIDNSTMTSLVVKEMEEGKIKGIIAHILKGQMEYDYEFKVVEMLATKYKIPLNKIETVYGYQDIEQIRLRLEAFSEMLEKK